MASFSIMLMDTLVSSPLFVWLWCISLSGRGISAEQSGINILPYMMSVVVGSGVGGWLNGLTGTYTPWMIIGPVLYGIAGGFLFTVNETTADAKLIGFQIMLGFGEGVSFNQPSMPALPRASS